MYQMLIELLEVRFLMHNTLSDRLVFGRITTFGPTSAVDGFVHTTATLPVARSDLAAAAIGTKVFFAGGYSIVNQRTVERKQVDIYDEAKNRWSVAKLSEARDSIAAAVVGSKIMFAGGDIRSSTAANVSSDVVDIFDNLSGRWSTTRLPTSAFGMDSIVVGDQAFFYNGAVISKVGGTTITSPNIHTYIYDSRTGQWSSHQALGAGTAVGHKAFFADGNGEIQVYDCNTGKWFRKAGTGAGSFTLAAHVGSKAVFEGISSSGGGGVGVVYDSLLGTWSSVRRPSTDGQIQSVSVGSECLFIGGGPVPAGSIDGSNGVDVYNAITGSWSRSVCPTYPQQPAAVVGKVAMLHWFSGNSVAVYDGHSGAWSEAIVSPRAANSQTLVSGGRSVFVAGGSGDLGLGDNAKVDIFTDSHPASNLVGGVGLAADKDRSVRVQITNDGDADYDDPFKMAIYASIGTTLNSHAILIGHVRVDHPLASGATIQMKTNLNIPKGIRHGTYNLIAAAGPGPRKQMIIFGTQQGALTI